MRTKLWVGKRDKLKLLRRPRRRWDDNNRSLGNRVGSCERIHLAQDRDQWRGVTNTVVKLLVP
jgi:hypothetical protein